MRVDGKPGNVYWRWSGGNLQAVNAGDGTVLLEINPTSNMLETDNIKITETANFAGIINFPDGQLLSSSVDLDNASQYGKYSKVAIRSLLSGDADEFAFAWENTTGEGIVITRVIVEVTTAGGSGTSTLSVGTAATATTEGDNLIVGADLNATNAYDSLDLANEGVATFQKLADGDFVTGRIKTANAAALEGDVYIFYCMTE